ncbi:hypothetical protein K493DRAFT_336171 [Basidiobolus meristosporus CBS 931.73]|uniref:Arrestin C-terminal-like domain-containing protein n=1 Tax=Basidiobolus meristosporus CBS 931.73 TaxID=1314790 RepID=A0A1Y1YKA8_9FUNG|nr:hypothetical protein K493DRAFT_336171 [Basidiobolus meristosporus CBS 931.73]|eukprot:ORX98412.1 hypothetical protein K493DRAFT_336171 [Basidiobolus meristosporus CBS 931.73]
MFQNSKRLPFLNKDAHITIQLENDVLTLHGAPQESVGCVLRGSVILQVNNPLKVKSIWLKFAGTARLNESDNISCREHVIVQQRLDFLTPDQGIRTLHNNQYCYPFELALDGSIPESTELPYGRIDYRMIAVVERPGLRFDLKARRTVLVQRNSSSNDSEALMYSSGAWQDRFRYHIAINEPTLVIGENIPISMDFTPLTSDLEIHKIQFRLLETTHYSGPGGSWDFRSQEYSLKSAKFSDFKRSASGPEGTSFQPELSLSSAAYPSLNTKYIQVKHALCILFIMNDKLRGERVVLQKDLPVVLRSSAQLSLDISPPRYQPLCSYVNIPPPSYTATSISA